LPEGYPVAFGHFPAAFPFSFNSAQWLPGSLSEHFLVAIGKKMANSAHFSQSSLFIFLNIKN
jgi:hypothetical protein